MNKELYKRSSTGVVIVAAIVGATFAGVIPTQILVFAICAFCSYELICMSIPEVGHLSKLTFVVFSCLPLAWVIAQSFQADTFLSHLPEFLNNWILPLLLLLYTFVVITAGSSKPFIHIASMAMSALLFSGGGIFAIDIISISPVVILGVFVLLWSNDVFAYLVGSRFGKTKLAASISPGKTWEGFIGGGVMCIATGVFLSLFITQLDIINWVVVSLLVVVFGTTGDLLQSAVKRHFQVKDSGKILPGHGGFWDRFDSFIGCVPFVSVYLVQTLG